ncbi:MAG: hypothetical protein C0518_07050 [Opitutus sp.]|nr:hypothetical protein [Opitutus sp.]
MRSRIRPRNRLHAAWRRAGGVAPHGRKVCHRTGIARGNTGPNRAAGRRAVHESGRSVQNRNLPRVNELRFSAPDTCAVDLLSPAGTVLLHYVFDSDAVATESPRPYAHPIRTLAGEVVTNFRPNDHPWHHGLSFTIDNLSGWNFWGGATYQRGDGYKLRADHGEQRHVAWIPTDRQSVAHRLEWRAGSEVMLQEERRLTAQLISPAAWCLRWQAEIQNVSGRALVCANYHSGEGLVGSHYTGLQFRGARELLDDHGDASLGVFAEGGLAGESAVHGAPARWMEWRGQKDTSLRKVTIRFENPRAPLHWFVRRNNPLAAFPFHFDRNLELPVGASFRIEHLLTFTDVF